MSSLIEYQKNAPGNFIFWHLFLNSGKIGFLCFKKTHFCLQENPFLPFFSFLGKKHKKLLKSCWKWFLLSKIRLIWIMNRGRLLWCKTVPRLIPLIAPKHGLWNSLGNMDSGQRERGHQVPPMPIHWIFHFSINCRPRFATQNQKTKKN